MKTPLIANPDDTSRRLSTLSRALIAGLLLFGLDLSSSLVAATPIALDSETAQSNDPYQWQGIVYVGESLGHGMAFRGSGFTVDDPRVIVTAAHLIFQKEYLKEGFEPSYMATPRWSWKHHDTSPPDFANAHEVPFFFIWSSFSAREYEEGEFLIEDDLGFRSDNYFNADLAIGGSFTPVAGGGTGIADWSDDGASLLGTPALTKTIVGYPATVSASNRWRMHHLPPSPYAFIPFADGPADDDGFPWSLYHSGQFNTAPGMSGGGVWVQHEGQWRAGGVTVSSGGGTRALDASARLLFQSVVDRLDHRHRGIVRRLGPLAESEISIEVPANSEDFDLLIGTLNLVGNRSDAPVSVLLQTLTSVPWLTFDFGSGLLSREDPLVGVTVRIDSRDLEPGSIHTIPLRFREGVRGENRRLNLTVRVAESGAPPPPTGLLVSDIAPRSFRLDWPEVPGAEGYRLDLAWDADFRIPVGNYVDFPASPGLTLHGLVPETTVHFRIRSDNAAGPSAHSPSGSATLAQRTGFSLHAVGDNTFGQLGDGTNESRQHLSFVRDNVAAIAAYGSHLLVLTLDGRLYLSGSFTHFVGNFIAPKLVDTEVDQISADSIYFIYSKRDGSVWGVGLGDYNPFAILPSHTLYQPVRMPLFAMGPGVKDLHAGQNDQFVVSSDGTLAGRGDNNLSQIRPIIPNEHSHVEWPVTIADQVVSVSASQHQVLYLTQDGVAWSSHANFLTESGQFWTSSIGDHLQVGEGIREVGTAFRTSVLLTAEGDLIAGGHNVHLNLSPNYHTTGNAEGPRVLASSVETFSVSDQTLLFRSDGRIYGMGRADTGALPGATGGNVHTPVVLGAWPGIPVAGYNASYLLLPPEAPAILAPPPSPLVGFGESATLVMPTRGPNLQFQWYEGPTGDTSKPVPGATSATLITPPVTADTRFWLRAWNEHGAYDGPAVRVRMKPHAEIPAGPIALSYGQTLTIEAVGPDHYTYAWFADPDLVAIVGHGRVLNQDFMSEGGHYWLRIQGQYFDTVYGPIEVTVSVTPIEVGDRLPIGHASEAGIVMAAGDNARGQLGDRSTTSRLTPVAVHSGVIGLAADTESSLFLEAGGVVRMTGPWPDVVMGRHPDTVATPGLPVRIAENIRTFAASSGIRVYLRDDGVIQTSVLNAKHLPPAAMPGENTVAVASAAQGILFLEADGRLYHGQIGSILGPRAVADQVVAIDGQANHGAFLRQDATLWIFGSDTGAPLVPGGNNWWLQAAFPIASDVVSFAASGRSFLYATADGGLYGYGVDFPQNTDPAIHSKWQPVKLADDAVRVAARDRSFYYINVAGELRAFGRNDFGQLGDGTTTDRSSPVLIDTEVLAVAAGPRHLLYLKRGELPAQIVLDPGSRRHPTGHPPELAIETIGHVDSIQWFGGPVGAEPEPIEGAVSHWFRPSTGTAAWSYFARVHHASGFLDSQAAVLTPEADFFPPLSRTVSAEQPGTLYHFGDGINHDALSHLPPGLASDPLAVSGNIVAFSASSSLLIQRTDGRLYGSGWNTYGQLREHRDPADGPILIANEARRFLAASDNNYYIDEDFRLYGLGANYNSQLGQTEGFHVHEPTFLADDVHEVAASADFTLILKRDGSLWLLGTTGHLSLGSQITAHAPVRIAQGVRQITARGPTYFWLDEDHVLWGAGVNVQKVLHEGAVWELLEAPVAIAENIISFSMGDSHLVFVDQDGVLWGRGGNLFGQLGAEALGTNSNPTVRVAEGVVDAVAGQRRTVFLDPAGDLYVVGEVATGTRANHLLSQFTNPYKLAGGVEAFTDGFYLRNPPSVPAHSSGDAQSLAVHQGERRFFSVEVAPGTTELHLAARSPQGPVRLTFETGVAFEAIVATARESAGDHASIRIKDPTPGTYVFSLHADDDRQEVLFRAHAGTLPPRQPGDPRPELVNISSRSLTSTGARVVIAGFVVGGHEPATILVTGKGRSLEDFNVPNVLPDPTLILYNQQGQEITRNTGWLNHPDADLIHDSGFAPSREEESAILATLPPGPYTAMLRNLGGLSGNGLVEVFDMGRLVGESGDNRLLNLSVRSFVGTGASVLIAGLVIEPEQGYQTLLVRGSGPSLAKFGLTDLLPDPVLRLFNHQGQLVETNTRWRDHWDADLIEASPFTPEDANEPALLLNLPPGAYTIHLRDSQNRQGIGVIELYRLE